LQLADAIHLLNEFKLPVFALEEEIIFPPVHFAEADGLLAIGGDLSVERLLVAYRKGIFPWYQGEDILWWCPDPRFVLFPEEMNVSKSMKALIKKNAFEFSFNQAFDEVIRSCKEISRPDQDGTWISDEVEEAYKKMHRLGHAISAETWKDGKLAGGLYGLRMGKIFFGESMFSLESNASKFAFIKLVEHLREVGVKLIDCQIYTNHLESLGARMIDRKEFIQLLEKSL
jgi:leucyl/phenylalanyl-tRNA---protein transferase